MSYRSAVGELAARQVGIEAGPPRVICDVCGVSVEITGKNRHSYYRRLVLWSKGWLCKPTDDGCTSRDLCPRCRNA